MKIMTVVGTRPEIIRLNLIIQKLDRYCDHVLVHTGQNYEDKLSAVFFKELRLREPNHYLGVRGDSFAEQIGKIIIEVEKVILKEKPDRILILGDTNSGLTSIVARRMGIPVFHMEAGNRCYDEQVPEEVNRKIIDHSSTVFLPYTYRSKENLLREGIPGEKIYVVGNPIYEVIEHYADGIDTSQVLRELGVQGQQYFLVTMHRAETVDDEDRLKNLLDGLAGINKKYSLPVICSLHPRTESKMQQFSLKVENEAIRLHEPFGFFDFVALEKKALAVITDSGTVQEECCILGVPSITIRDVTERPETIESGSNMLVGVSLESMLNGLEVVLNERQKWEPPAGYLATNVSSRVAKIVLGHINE
jgi:UDP-N-acetylglucosamine 2-epimerase (non-hydrolysing)